MFSNMMSMLLGNGFKLVLTLLDLERIHISVPLLRFHLRMTVRFWQLAHMETMTLKEAPASTISG